MFCEEFKCENIDTDGITCICDNHKCTSVCKENRTCVDCEYDEDCSIMD